MRQMLEGGRLLRRSPGLVILLLVLDLALAPLLARLFTTPGPVPPPALAETGGTSFGPEWRSAWSEWETGGIRRLGPDVFGLGVRGGEAEPRGERWGLGLFALLARALATGGILGVLRAPQGPWKFRGFVLGARFYFPRLVRAALLSAAAMAIAMVISSTILGRRAVLGDAALAVAALLIHMVASYAKISLVVEDRPSAVLGFVTALGFVRRHPARAPAPYVVAAALGALLLFGGRFPLGLVPTTVFVAAGITLRLWLLATQVAVHRSCQASPPSFVAAAGIR